MATKPGKYKAPAPH